MNRVEILHNPFIVDTQFLINGKPPAQSCKLSSYKESRLQTWIEKLFGDLSDLFNGDERYAIVFTGVESDFLDVKEAADIAIEHGAQVKLEFKDAAASEDRLAAIRALRTKAERNPDFERFINTPEASEAFDEAFNRDFDVYVVATMSSGKSTLINAMLGRDLLPALNEATTATIATIADNEKIGARFKAKRTDSRRQVLETTEDATLEDIKAWNSDPNTFRIDIEGNIEGIRERDNVRLVLSDTPGPNNSQNEEHARVTMKHIQDSKRNPMILYVLNAVQLGIKDDKNLLSLVAEAMKEGGKQSKDRFIFVINKMDVFDPEKGECISGVLSRVTKYLNENGIHTPLIYPVSANLARVLRIPSDKQTKVDRRFHFSTTTLFEEVPEMNLLQYAPITSRVRRNIEGRGLSPIMLSTGLPTVEATIDEYIDKYNIPHRVKRAYDTMMDAIKRGLNEAEVNAQLDADTRSLSKIKEQIATLMARKKQGFEVNAFKARLEREGMSFPPEIETNLKEIRISSRAKQRQFAEMFKGSSSISGAEARIREAKIDLDFEFSRMINAYESAFMECQKMISKKLHDEYKNGIIRLFADCGDLNLPIMDSLLKQASEISVDIKIRNDDISERDVVVGKKEVSDSRWYNPFSWGRTKTENIWGTEKEVVLDDFWGKQQTSIDAEFDRLCSDAEDKINNMKDTLTKKFIDFMSAEFDTRFSAMLEDLEKKTSERKECENAIADGLALKKTIESFKAELDETIAV